jgi:hypothetical protein
MGSVWIQIGNLMLLHSLMMIFVHLSYCFLEVLATFRLLDLAVDLSEQVQQSKLVNERRLSE